MIGPLTGAKCFVKDMWSAHMRRKNWKAKQGSKPPLQDKSPPVTITEHSIEERLLQRRTDFIFDMECAKMVKWPNNS